MQTATVNGGERKAGLNTAMALKTRGERES